jgi:hypothetical protein
MPVLSGQKEGARGAAPCTVHSKAQGQTPSCSAVNPNDIITEAHNSHLEAFFIKQSNLAVRKVCVEKLCQNRASALLYVALAHSNGINVLLSEPVADPTLHQCRFACWNVGTQARRSKSARHPRARHRPQPASSAREVPLRRIS